MLLRICGMSVCVVSCRSGVGHEHVVYLEFVACLCVVSRLSGIGHEHDILPRTCGMSMCLVHIGIAMSLQHS